MRITFKLPTLTQCVRLLLCLPFSLAQAGELNLSYGLGVRNDGLRWAVAADLFGTPPNILSELTWRNLQGSEQAFGLEYIASSGWLGRANLRLTGFNMGGEVQDSDYTLDNRNGEFSRSLNATHGSTAQDAALLIGRRFYMNENTTLAITPVIGLSRNISDLRSNNGVQVIPASGPYPNLDNRYRAQFSSMLAGAETRWWFASPFGLDMKWHHHWINYHAEADWNLRTDLQHPVSFYQDGKGSDDRWELGLLARLNKDWTMELAYSRLKGSLQNGLHVDNNSTFPLQQSTLLREVVWSSASTSLIAQRTF
jgi:Protochlamydia outer membrane protein